MHFEDQMVSFFFLIYIIKSLSDEEQKLIIRKITNEENLKHLG
jgi:hypothetical protein